MRSHVLTPEGRRASAPIRWLAQGVVMVALVAGCAALVQAEIDRVAHWPGGWSDAWRRALFGPLPAAVLLSSAHLRSREGIAAAAVIPLFVLATGFLYAHSESSTAAIVFLPNLLLPPAAIAFVIWQRTRDEDRSRSSGSRGAPSGIAG